jgi:hypothetical protein
MSNRLLNELRKYPLLYYAVEESLISEKNGYYSIGIIVWYELLKILGENSKQDAGIRGISAHDILKIRPTKQSYDDLLGKFKKAAEKCYLKELAKAKDKKIYDSAINKKWRKFITKM